MQLVLEICPQLGVVVPVGDASVPVPVRTREHLLDIRLLNLQKGDVHSLLTMLIYASQ